MSAVVAMFIVFVESKIIGSGTFDTCKGIAQPYGMKARITRAKVATASTPHYYIPTTVRKEEVAYMPGSTSMVDDGGYALSTVINSVPCKTCGIAPKDGLCHCRCIENQSWMSCPTCKTGPLYAITPVKKAVRKSRAKVQA